MEKKKHLNKGVKSSKIAKPLNQIPNFKKYFQTFNWKVTEITSKS